jgi:hypothetical protein
MSSVNLNSTGYDQPARHRHSRRRARVQPLRLRPRWPARLGPPPSGLDALRVEVRVWPAAPAAQGGGGMSDPHKPYLNALAPLITTLVRIAPAVLAAEASRETPHVWESEPPFKDLMDGILSRFPEDEANAYAVADALEQAARG